MRKVVEKKGNLLESIAESSLGKAKLTLQRIKMR